MIQEFENYLCKEEKSAKTIEKYIRDIKKFIEYCGNSELSKEKVISYKKHLAVSYRPNSANSMIASLNSYLRYIERNELCIKQFRIQRKIYCNEESELTKAEYIRLINAARNTRINLIIQTICGTGIRVSELKYVTVEGVNSGEFTVSCKSKTRTVFIVRELQKKLKKYIKDKGIESGSIFVTKNGKPIDRTTVWREMKRLCKTARVKESKVFPHNLRHLFARTFYGVEKDIAKLADILGHSSINTTRIYVITTGAEHRRRMECMHLII